MKNLNELLKKSKDRQIIAKKVIKENLITKIGVYNYIGKIANEAEDSINKYCSTFTNEKFFKKDNSILKKHLLIINELLNNIKSNNPNKNIFNMNMTLLAYGNTMITLQITANYNQSYLSNDGKYNSKVNLSHIILKRNNDILIEVCDNHNKFKIDYDYTTIIKKKNIIANYENKMNILKNNIKEQLHDYSSFTGDITDNF